MTADPTPLETKGYSAQSIENSSEYITVFDELLEGVDGDCFIFRGFETRSLAEMAGYLIKKDLLSNGRYKPYVRQDSTNPKMSELLIQVGETA